MRFMDAGSSELIREGRARIVETAEKTVGSNRAAMEAHDSVVALRGEHPNGPPGTVSIAVISATTTLSPRGAPIRPLSPRKDGSDLQHCHP